jgi:hypothetical protein
MKTTGSLSFRGFHNGLSKHEFEHDLTILGGPKLTFSLSCYIQYSLSSTREGDPFTVIVGKAVTRIPQALHNMSRSHFLSSPICR